MTPEEAIERFRDFRTKLNSTLPKFVAQTAMDASALIVHRIQEQGNNSEEVSLGNYSANKLPTFFFAEKGNKAARKKLAKDYPDGISYSEWRKLNGRQVGHVDLTFTRGGAGMFGSTGIVAESFSDGIVNVKVAGRDEFTQNKLDWNSDRYGDVLKLSKKEELLLQESFEEYLSELVQSVGL